MLIYIKIILLIVLVSIPVKNTFNQIKFMFRSKQISQSSLQLMKSNPYADYDLLYKELKYEVKPRITENQNLYVFETEKFDRYFYQYPLIPIDLKNNNPEKYDLLLSRKDLIDIKILEENKILETAHFILWKK